MEQVLSVARLVATPLSLLAFVAAVGYFAYSRYLQREEKRLEALPPEDRARIADEYLTRYGINGAN